MKKEIVCKCGNTIDISIIPKQIKDRMIKQLQDLDLENDEIFEKL